MDIQFDNVDIEMEQISPHQPEFLIDKLIDEMVLKNMSKARNIISIQEDDQ